MDNASQTQQALYHIFVAIGHYSQLEKNQENEMALQELKLAVEQLQANSTVAAQISFTAQQIYMMASFIGLAVAEPEKDDMDRAYTLEMDVMVDGVKEDFYLSDPEYPEEGGSILRVEDVPPKSVDVNTDGYEFL